ncbi:hypothetical protein J6590_032263 [Homalodisca vitripennis]|nr:hypothetical protein J6590_032263 [Homalodisca vitripennis]
MRRPGGSACHSNIPTSRSVSYLILSAHYVPPQLSLSSASWPINPTILETLFRQIHRNFEVFLRTVRVMDHLRHCKNHPPPLSYISPSLPVADPEGSVGEVVCPILTNDPDPQTFEMHYFCVLVDIRRCAGARYAFINGTELTDSAPGRFPKERRRRHVLVDSPSSSSTPLVTCFIAHFLASDHCLSLIIRAASACRLHACVISSMSSTGLALILHKQGYLQAAGSCLEWAHWTNRPYIRAKKTNTQTNNRMTLRPPCTYINKVSSTTLILLI